MTVPTRPVRIASNIFDWLDEVRLRPGMYLRDGNSLASLESMIWGYEAAISIHRIDEPTPRFDRTFLSWVRLRRGWSTSLGWADAIHRAVREGQRPLDLFFALVDEYRKVTPQVLARARLTSRNKATGKTGTDGLGRARPPPLELQIVRYAPDKLFLLRYRYPSSIEDSVLFDNGSHATSLSFAKDHARREFGVTAEQWKRVPAVQKPRSSGRRKGR